MIPRRKRSGGGPWGSGPRDPVAIGERAREKRRELGISQEELAQRLGCSVKSVSRFETGMLTHLRASDVAKALGVTESWIECGMGPVSPVPHEPRPNVSNCKVIPITRKLRARS